MTRRHKLRALHLLVAAVTLAGCASASKHGGPASFTLPGASQGYLSNTNSEVVFIQLGRQGNALSGTENWAEVKGAVPYEQVSTGDSNVIGSLTQTGVELGFGGSAAQFGTVSSSGLQIEVPQPDGTLAGITFTVASVSDYNSALEQLRSLVSAANTTATTTTTLLSPSSVAPSGGPAVGVVACPTAYGAGRPAPRPTPGPIPVDLPGSTASELSFYSIDTYGDPPILAPQGWQCDALVGADGSTTINVYPPGGSRPPTGTIGRPAVVAHSDSACQGCVYGTVCRFVPGAGAQLGYTTMNCPAAPTGESTYWIKGSAQASPPISDLIGFEDPANPDPTDGVVLYDYSSQQGAASEDDCTLPSSEHALCTAILNNFTADAWLMH